MQGSHAAPTPRLPLVTPVFVVTPAKAGAYVGTNEAVDGWTPAFAGVTVGAEATVGVVVTYGAGMTVGEGRRLVA